MEIFNKIKKKLKSSFKSVIFNFKEFCCIYIAIVIVQLLFGVWTLSTFTNYHANDDLFNEKYNYDVIIKGDNSLLTSLANRINYDINNGGESVVDFTSYKNQLCVNLTPGSFDEFYEEYIEKEILKLEYSVTPKYVYFSDLRGDIVISSVILGVAAFIIGILILAIMYSVRTNHYKYQYGLYMTFGADKKMLGGIALGELMAINTVTLIPSALLSYLLALTVYASSGVTVVVNALQILLYVAVSYLAVIIAALTSLGGFFGKAPIDLITTADNSNFVSSPRRSWHLFGKKMPLQYESFSVWRFRKYIARLVLGAVLFSVVFVSGIYCANMIYTDNNVSSEEFSVDFKYSENDAIHRDRANAEAVKLLPELQALENVDKVTFEQSKSLTDTMDHIILTPGTELMGVGATVVSDEVEGFSRAMNKARYVCMNPLALNNYEALYQVEYLDGYDAEKILKNKNMIVVSESLYGSRAFDFEVGDKIVVAQLVRVNQKLVPESDPLKFLRQQISNSTFAYKEYTVGAVIHDNAVDGSIIIGMNPDEFKSVTGKHQVIGGFNVYAKAGLDLDDVDKLNEDMKSLMSRYEAWSYETTDNAVCAIVDNRINLPGLIGLACILVLLISPVVWIFSQVMFYKKREQEFRTLTSIGATMKEIGGIHAVSGVIIFIVSFVVNFALSRLVCFGIYRIFTNLLPRLGILGPSASFDSFVPWPIVLLCAAVSAVCGCISSLIPFILYKKKLERESREIVPMNFDIER